MGHLWRPRLIKSLCNFPRNSWNAAIVARVPLNSKVIRGGFFSCFNISCKLGVRCQCALGKGRNWQSHRYDGGNWVSLPPNLTAAPLPIFSQSISSRTIEWLFHRVFPPTGSIPCVFRFEAFQHQTNKPVVTWAYSLERDGAIQCSFHPL